MSVKSSWRLSFTDVDSSLVASTSKDEVIGAMVIRAPKGVTKFAYFGAGNESAIKAYFGTPSSNWADIQEAIDFNKSFGLYISAPAGSSDEYKSYYGGKYLTSEGLKDFYNVTSVDNIDNTESKELSEISTIKTYVAPFSSVKGKIGSVTDLAFCIEGISASNWKKMDQFALEFWGNDAVGQSAQTAYYSIDKSSHKIYAQDEDYAEITDAYAGVWVKGSNGYNIILGGADWLEDQLSSTDDLVSVLAESTGTTLLKNLSLTSFSSNTSDNENIPLLSVYTLDESAGKILNLMKENGETDSDINVIWSAIKAFHESNTAWDASQFLSDGSVVYGGTLYELPETLGDASGQLFTGILDISDSIFASIYQRSATNTSTTVKITSIGYDKYKYDFDCPMIVFNGKISELPSSVVDELAGDWEKFIFVNKSAIPAIADSIPGVIYTFTAGQSDDSVMANKICSSASSTYLTKTVLVTNTYFVTVNSDGSYTSSNPNADWYHEHLYVKSSSTLCRETEDGTYALKEDLNYNTIKYTTTETVDGETMTDGAFTGSLDEQGEDSYGNNIYFPNVVSDTDLHFCDIKVENTFDDYLDEHGIYCGTRIIDDVLVYDTTGTVCSSSKSFVLKGQRYMTYTVQQNIDAGVVGNVYREDQLSALKLGWEEFQSTDYDPVYIAMDPVGVVDIQDDMASIRNSSKSGQQFCTFLSNRRLSTTEAANVSTIVVSGQERGCAQLVNEFKFYDSTTGKNFYRTLIGAYGKACATIMQNGLGGKAPAWMNYNGMGGQLSYSGTCLDSKWKFTEDDLEALDKKGLNPAIYDSDVGIMVESQKCTTDPDNISDWSYLGHSMSFDICKRNIRDNVMVPQIMKPINETWMNFREKQCNAILALRTSGSKKCWQEATCIINDSSLNNDTTKANREFKILVRVKVEPFSETVSLTFENVGQSMSVYDSTE